MRGKTVMSQTNYGALRQRPFLAVYPPIQWYVEREALMIVQTATLQTDYGKSIRMTDLLRETNQNNYPTMGMPSAFEGAEGQQE
jgi:hypothetical protein